MTTVLMILLKKSAKVMFEREKTAVGTAVIMQSCQFDTQDFVESCFKTAFCLIVLSKKSPVLGILHSMKATGPR